jgi:hypothetical protein
VAGIVAMVLAVILAHRKNILVVLRQARQGKLADTENRPAVKGVSE